jgi:predicted metal-dependent hydrolase
MSDRTSPDLFDLGLKSFQSQEYFEAHDLWEELWADHGLPDRAFIQGLIQLAVAIVHLENNNLNGARSLGKHLLNSKNIRVLFAVLMWKS